MVRSRRHDDRRVVAYLPSAEAHSRGIFYEHLRRVSGELLDDPHPAQSPGDYNVVDMRIFMSLRQEPPADTLERAFRRREAARLIGDKKLEAELLTVTQKLGKVLRDPRRYAAIVSLESLLAKD